MDLNDEELKATRELKAINKIVAGDEKTADEMFKELGYTIQKKGNGAMIYYEYYNKKTEDIMQFWYDKTVSKYNEKTEETDYISMQELQAINKKVEELGWI